MFWPFADLPKKVENIANFVFFFRFKVHHRTPKCSTKVESFLFHPPDVSKSSALRFRSTRRIQTDISRKIEKERFLQLFGRDRYWPKYGKNYDFSNFKVLHRTQKCSMGVNIFVGDRKYPQLPSALRFKSIRR